MGKTRYQRRLEREQRLRNKRRFEERGRQTAAQIRKTQRENEEWYQMLSMKAGHAEGALSNIKKELFSDEALASFSSKLKADLGWLSILTSVLAIPFNLYRIIHALAISKEHRFRRSTQVLIAGSGIAFAILTAIAAVGVVYIAVPILLVAGAVKSTLENIWGIGVSLYDRFIGVGRAYHRRIARFREHIKNNWPGTYAQLNKLTELINRERKLNEWIALRSHSFVQSAFALVGATLLFSPITAPAGAVILACTAAYGIADVVGLNPLKWAMRGINFLSNLVRGKPLFTPFAPKTISNVRADLLRELQHENINRNRMRQPINERAFYTHPQYERTLSHAGAKSVRRHSSESSVLKEIGRRQHRNPLKDIIVRNPVIKAVPVKLNPPPWETKKTVAPLKPVNERAKNEGNKASVKPKTVLDHK